jgi:cell division septal protein FtsQ
VVTKKRLFWLVVWSIAVVFLGNLLFGRTFRIREIECRRDGEQCRDQIMAEIKKIEGRSLLTFKAADIVSKLEKADPSIQLIKAESHLPDKVILSIVSRKPFAIISTSTNSASLLVDAQGFVFQKDKDFFQLLPTVLLNSDTNLSLDELNENQEIKQACRLIAAMQDNFVNFKTLEIRENSFVIFLDNKVRVIFSQDDDFENKVTSLQRILSQATIESKEAIIDLRYQKPVIKNNL